MTEQRIGREDLGSRFVPRSVLAGYICLRLLSALLSPLTLHLVSRAGSGRRLGSGSRIPPGLQSLVHKFRDRPAIFRDYFPPGVAAEHGEINSAEAEARDQNIDAASQWLVGD